MENITQLENHAKNQVFLAARNLMHQIKRIQENENKLNFGEFE